MRTAAMTRIHRSSVILRVWLKYYSRYFDDLIVFAGRHSGNEPDKFEELLSKYQFELITMPEEFYSEAAHNLVFAKQKELLVDHSWVLYSDADEIVVADPDKYDGLRHYMDVCLEDQTFCKGYDIFQAEDEGPLDYGQSLLKQRQYWAKDMTKSYHKPCLSRIPTDWGLGFHYIKGMQENIENLPFMGLYLLHLKYIDPTREFDFPKDQTGNGIRQFKDRAEAIPARIRELL